MNDGDTLLTLIGDLQDQKQFQALNWKGSFRDYLHLAAQNPRVARTAFQRIYDMILSYGYEELPDNQDRLTRYSFFTHPSLDENDAVFGLEPALMRLVNFFEAAAKGYGIEKRVLLLHGPVGSAKSTIVRRLKRGLEQYSRSEAGALYTFDWYLGELPEEAASQPGFYKNGSVLSNNGTAGFSINSLGLSLRGTQAQEPLVTWEPCPMHEEPFHLIPLEMRERFLEQFNAGRDLEDQLRIEGDLCPPCRYYQGQLLDRYDGDFTQMIRHIRVRRLVFSESERLGIGTFQPKDEKKQDSTELTGAANPHKIARYGSDSDPRAFNFDGEFNVANRGLVEFVEMLKLEVAFLYDLLGASQEHKIKAKKAAQIDIDEVIIGHTNAPEYRRLENDEFMEALKDRTVRIDVPYNIRLQDELRIYQRDFQPRRVPIHIAPHTLEMAALWAVLTRLEKPKRTNLTLRQKAKLYDGQTLPGVSDEDIKAILKESAGEGMTGISPRYVQDKISNTLVNFRHNGYINPFMVLAELEAGLTNHPLITDDRERKRYRDLFVDVRREYTEIVKNEVQRAISADEDSVRRLYATYIDNVKVYTQHEKLINKFTGQAEEPDEWLMRSIEKKVDIPDSRKDAFRSEIMNRIGALAIEGKSFDYKTNGRLHKALELKLFEDQKDSLNLATLVSRIMDKETEEKIEEVKARLIRDFGYNEQSAVNVLKYVASLLADPDETA